MYVCIIVYDAHRSLRSSIRSGASNIVTGIVNLTRAGSMRMRNSIRRQGSIRRQEEINEARAATSINRGRSVSSSEQQLLAEPPSSGLDHLVDDSAGAAQSMNDNTVRTAPPLSPPPPSLSSYVMAELKITPSHWPSYVVTNNSSILSRLLKKSFNIIVMLALYIEMADSFVNIILISGYFSSDDLACQNLLLKK